MTKGHDRRAENKHRKNQKTLTGDCTNS
ncbi:hypothetical protein FRACA_250008 [Frankia canadensis]|uniref:Uncharacterized protein n=1 Tax=Frankia canadensis TaxID=1836972 RepID=A0A2I2KRY8_9ACTN|nr:hypothetical protein FRACA_250008 [Frankia canadensis]SOU55723.1 hypothetical protein FRACA_250008 [Frankia canadensis]